MIAAANPSAHRRLVGCLAVAIIGVGLVLAVWLSRGTLAAASFEIDGETIDCAIRNSRGNLNFHAERNRGAFARGWSSMTRMGDAAEIGTNDVKLSYDAAANRIRVQVGRGAWEFDPKDQYLRPLKTD